jgi:hypothetical protein
MEFARNEPQLNLALQAIKRDPTLNARAVVMMMVMKVFTAQIGSYRSVAIELISIQLD